MCPVITHCSFPPFSPSRPLKKKKFEKASATVLLHQLLEPFNLSESAAGFLKDYGFTTIDDIAAEPDLAAVFAQCPSLHMPDHKIKKIQLSAKEAADPPKKSMSIQGNENMNPLVSPPIQQFSIFQGSRN